MATYILRCVGNGLTCSALYAALKWRSRPFIVLNFIVCHLEQCRYSDCSPPGQPSQSITIRSEWNSPEYTQTENATNADTWTMDVDMQVITTIETGRTFFVCLSRCLPLTAHCTISPYNFFFVSVFKFDFIPRRHCRCTTHTHMPKEKVAEWNEQIKFI